MTTKSCSRNTLMTLLLSVHIVPLWTVFAMLFLPTLTVLLMVRFKCDFSFCHQKRKNPWLLGRCLRAFSSLSFIFFLRPPLHAFLCSSIPLHLFFSIKNFSFTHVHKCINHLEEGKSLEVLRDTEVVGGEVGGMCLVGGARWGICLVG
jgi:hypothetical protein